MPWIWGQFMGRQARQRLQQKREGWRAAAVFKNGGQERGGRRDGSRRDETEVERGKVQQH